MNGVGIAEIDLLNPYLKVVNNFVQAFWTE
jgi:hypothetical protein